MHIAVLSPETFRRMKRHWMIMKLYFELFSIK